jgi:hypothetical protein
VLSRLSLIAAIAKAFGTATTHHLPDWGYNLGQQFRAKNLTTVAILPISDANGKKSYRAIVQDT